MISYSSLNAFIAFVVSRSPVALQPAVRPGCSDCSFGKNSVSFGKKAESAGVFLLCRKMFVSLHRLSRERGQRWGATFNGSKDAYYRV